MTDLRGLLLGSRLGVVAPSGRASEAIADRAQEEGPTLPPFAGRTIGWLRQILPDFGAVRSPLVVTG